MRIRLLTVLFLPGCLSGDSGSPVDAATDASPVDAAPVDAAPVDAAPVDAAPVDAALVDAAPVDAAPVDAAPVDAAPPDADAPLPDLTLMESDTSRSMEITEEYFPPDHCAVDECLTGSGDRTLIRFHTSAANLGDAHIVLGEPDESSDLWEWHPCHDHWHYKSFAEYKLLNEDGTVAAQGHKMSFCLRDVWQIVAGSPSQNFDCHHQGISAGWADVYSSDLDCQFIDITDVPPGDYRLSIELDPRGLIQESDDTNNVSLFEVTIP